MDGQKTHAGHFKTRHHHKPYLLRHLSLLVTASWLIFTGLLGFTLSQLPAGHAPAVLSARVAAPPDALVVFSSDGLSFSYDSGQLRIDEKLNIVQISSRPGADPLQASTRLTIQLGGTDLSDENPDTTLLSTTSEAFAGDSFQKKVYQHTVTIGDRDYQAYSLEWTGAKDGKTTVLSLDGLQNPNVIPAAYKTVIDTLAFAPGGQVLGAKQQLPESYTVDAVSPATVKIYRVTCGTLVVDGQEIGGDRCDASAASGFLVSADGHIATNGHVVTRGAEDVLIDVLLQSPLSLNNFLKYLGMSDQQIRLTGNSPELLAAVIARLYDAPEGVISLKNKRGVLIAALGSRSPEITSEQDARQLLDFKNTDHLKRAELVASNYSAKDLFVLGSGDAEGFSASDVALIKIDAPGTPHYGFFNRPVTQNQKITIIGFPGDAENILTDNNSLSVTATNGSISAIRVAAGSAYKLYQSDADASRGNSGGPVIDETGRVLGLLTYRYKNADAADAAKSYIRDIEDLRKLAKDKNINLDGQGSTQIAWTNGLRFFSENRFTKALHEFEKVKDAYPAHRLVGSYLQAAEQGVIAGQDVQDLPFSLVAAISFIGAGGAAGAVILIARHHSRHLAYKLASSTDTFMPRHANT